MGLIFGFLIHPTLLDIANNSLTAVMHMNMLDSHFLLPLTAITVERFHLSAEGAGKLDEVVDATMQIHFRDAECGWRDRGS